MADSDSDETENRQLNESDSEDEESEDDIEMNDIYYVDVVNGEQKEKHGPFSYVEFKEKYRDESNDKLTFMSPIWNGLDISEWTQIFKLDRIFKDLDPKKFTELKDKPVRSPTDEKRAQNAGNANANASKPANDAQNMAQPMTLKQLQEKEAKEEEHRARTQPLNDGPMIE